MSKFPHSGELSKSGEPPKSDGLHFSGHIPNSGEPTYSGRLRSISKILKFDGLPKSGESSKSDELKKTIEPHQDYLTTEPHLRTSLSQKGKAAARQTGKPLLKEQTTRARQKAEACLSTRPSLSRQGRLNSTVREFSKCSHKSSFEPSSYDCVLGSSDTGGSHHQPAGDLREHLTHKHTIHEANPWYHCERLIKEVFVDCQCTKMVKPSVFEKLSQ